MIHREITKQLRESANRRDFLKAVAALGAGTALGGTGLTALLRRGRYDAPGVSNTRVAMGTFVTISIASAPRALAEDAIAAAFAEMQRVVDLLNRHDDRSPVSQLNRSGHLRRPPRELADVLGRALEMNRATNGAFDVTVAPLVDLFARSGPGGPAHSDIEEAMRLVGGRFLECDREKVSLRATGSGVTLDGIAKGYVVDRMADVLGGAGIDNFLVDAGGDIFARGNREGSSPWRVAVQDPDHRGRYPDVIELSNAAVATSGSYEVFYDDDRVFHHIVDPRTGCSPHHAVSASIRARRAVDADAIATAALVLKPDAVRRLADAHRGCAALIVGADGTLAKSSRWG